MNRSLRPRLLHRTWDATSTGNRTLDPALARSLNAKYGQAQVQLGLRVLTTGQNTVVMGTPAKTRPALVRQIQDPKFQQMLAEVQNAHMSLGRNLVGSTFLNKHPEAGKYISGGIDGTFDFAATPLMKAGEVTKAARVINYGLDEARVGSYLAGDAGSMYDLLDKPAVDRYMRKAGQYLQQGDYAGLQRFDPRFDKIVTALKQEGVDSAESLKDWFAGEAGTAAILSGRAARISQGVAIVPHLTPFGWLKAGVKEALQNGIDRLADGKVTDLNIPLDGTDVAGDAKTLQELLRSGEAGSQAGRIPGVSNVARLIRRMSTNISQKGYIDLGMADLADPMSSGADVSNLRRMLQGFLPAKRVDDVVNVFLGSDVGTRRLIVTGAREQMLHALGAYGSPSTAQATEDALAAIKELEREQTYSVGGLDQVLLDDGKSHPEALLKTQLSNRVAIPLPNDVRKFVREQRALGRLGINPVIWATRFMFWWRTAVLDRLGFAVRVGGTENLSRLLRLGPGDFLASYVANGAAQTRTDEEIAADVERWIKSGELDAATREAEIAAQRAMATKPLTPYHPVERILAVLADRVPEGVRPYVDTAEKFYGAVLGATARKAVRTVERKGLSALGMDDFITAATHLATHQPAVEAAFNDVMNFLRGSEGYAFAPGGVGKLAKQGLDVAIASFSEAKPSDPLWRMKWQVALDQIAQDPLARAVLESIDKTSRTQERAVLRVLNDPSFEDVKSKFVRASRLPDGRVVGIDATQQEADLAWARGVRKHVNALVRSGDPVNGDVLHDVVREMLDTGRGPVQDTLDAVAHRDLPASTYGPDILPVSRLHDLFQKSFEVVVGRPANWLFRQPAFIQAYAEALPAAREYAFGIITDNPDQAEKLASDIATEGAVNSVLPFIHNPQLRTQFEDQHRILFPFLFAQRQFLQRWGRLALDSPDAIRKIQLTMHGLRTMGFIRKDTNGHTYFYYPGSEYPQELITGVLTRLGIKASVPMVVPFTGQVQYLMPGLSNPVTPSVGPFATVSMKELGKLMPELNPEVRALQGQGATSPAWQQFTPEIFNRAWNALAPEQRTSELASTTMQAIKYLDYAGYTLPNNATSQQIEQYVSRVQNWARSLLVMRAALGFGLPASPKATLDPKHLDSRWHLLLNQLGYTQGTAEFIREHPTATAYTVGESQTMTDGYTPATKASLDWMNAHLTFAKAHPLAAAWFVPRSGSGFTPAAYREQIALGMRTERQVSTTSPSSPGFLQEVIMSRAANVYYKTLTRYEKAYTATSSSAEHQRLTHWWDTWKASFFKINPIFGDYITSGDAHIRRLNTIADVQKALTTPSLPKSPLVPAMRAMIGNYEQFVNDYTSTTGLYSSSMT